MQNPEPFMIPKYVEFRKTLPKTTSGKIDKKNSVEMNNKLLMISVCELETQILLTGDLDLIEKSELGTQKKGITEIEKMLKALIKFLENKPLNP